MGETAGITLERTIQARDGGETRAGGRARAGGEAVEGACGDGPSWRFAYSSAAGLRDPLSRVTSGQAIRAV